MKKQILTTLSLAIIAGVLSLTSCKTEDAGAPMITVTGGANQSQSLPSIANNGTWTNPTATAMDDEDGDISMSITVSGTVNPNTAGNYELTYTVSDAAGNTATEILVVTIANDAADFNGVYNVHDSVPFLPAFLYTIKVTPSQTINNRIEFDYNTGVLGFAYYQNNGNIYATSTGTGIGATVTLPFQIANTIGSPAENHDFQGNGTVLATSPFKFNITYTDHNISNSSTASGCIMTLTKI